MRICLKIYTKTIPIIYETCYNSRDKRNPEGILTDRKGTCTKCRMRGNYGRIILQKYEKQFYQSERVTGYFKRFV